MSEIALMDHEEIVNRAFKSSKHQPEYFDQNSTLRWHGNVPNRMQLQSVMDPNLCPPRITYIPPYTSMAYHDELHSFYEWKLIFVDARPTLVSHAPLLYFITAFSY